MKRLFCEVYFIFFSVLISEACLAQEFEWTQYSTGSGALGADAAGMGIGMDTLGNAYVAGYYSHTIFWEGDSMPSLDGSTDILIAKYDSSGVFQWAESAGSFLHDRAVDIAVDQAGNSYVVGTIEGIAFFDTLTLNSSLGNVFVAKYDPDGRFLWVSPIGGGPVDAAATAIAVNSTGQVFVTGDFRITAYFYDAGSAFPSDTLFSTTALANDAFVACYSSGGGLLWAKRAGGTSADCAGDITTDGDGNAWITGEFSGIAFFEGQSVSSQGGRDIFVARYNPNGDVLAAHGIGSLDGESAGSISIDASDNVYLTGSVSNMLILGQDTLSWVESGGAFLAKFDENMTPLWAREPVSFNFTGICFNSVAPASSGRCYVSGSFNGARAIFGTDTLRSAPGSNEMLTACYSDDGDIIWARQAGLTTANESGYDVYVSKTNRAYVAGGYTGYATFGADTLDDGPGIFLSKFRTLQPIVGVEPLSRPVQSLMLAQNYPNPFNPSTTITFEAPLRGTIQLEILNVLGQRVKMLLNEDVAGGIYTLNWDGRDASGNDVSSGIYIYRLVNEGATISRKMLLVR